MAIIRAYTTIEQSRKLAEILPLESADMFILFAGDREIIRIHDRIEDYKNWEPVHVWSLAALLSVLPYPYIEQNHKGKWLCRVEHENTTYIWEDSNPVDACYEVIIKLNELNLL